MAQIDIQGLFKDVLPNEVVEDKSEGLRAADLVGTLGGMAAYYGPQRERQLRRAAGGMLGVDLRTEAEAAREDLQQLGTPQTAEQHQKYADILDRVQPGSGVQYMMGVAEQEQEKARTAAATTSAEAQMMNARTQQAALPSELAARHREIDVREGELELAGQTQSDLGAWRDIQNANVNRELAMKEEKNRIDLFLGEIQESALGAADKKAIREATANYREQHDLAIRSVNIAGQYLALEPLSGGEAMIAEKWKALLGNEDEKTTLRTEFNQIKNNMVMESLPPGVASDKDIAIAMSGFPSATADPEYIAQYMRGMAKLAAITAERESARAIHLAENAGLDHKFAAEWEATMTPAWEESLAKEYDLTWKPETDEQGNIVEPLSQADVDEIKALNSEHVAEQNRRREQAEAEAAEEAVRRANLIAAQGAGQSQFGGI
jgi:hypothetical protein